MVERIFFLDFSFAGNKTVLGDRDIEILFFYLCFRLLAVEGM